MSNLVSKLSCFVLLIVCWATHAHSSYSTDEKCSSDQSNEKTLMMANILPCENNTPCDVKLPCEIAPQKIRSFTMPILINPPAAPSSRKTSAPVGSGEIDTILQEKKVVLLIEDNLVVKRVFEKHFLSHENSGPFLLKTALSAEKGIEIFIHDHPMIIFVDYEFCPETLDDNPKSGDENKVKIMNGKEVILEIKRLYKAMHNEDFPGTFIGFSSQPDFNREMLLAGASHAIPKAIDIPLLRKVLGIVLNGGG